MVKVAGGNISHKLRLSSVKPSDEGTYECCVIDYSSRAAQHHRVRAHLQVDPDSSQRAPGVEQHEAELSSQGSLQARHRHAQADKMHRYHL